jgi:hypothetical protein
VAGDWIKFEKATLTKPEILVIADRLSIHRLHAVGLCLTFWSWCDEQLTSRHASSVTESMIDSVIGVTGFASALLEIGWLRVRNGSLEVPNLDRHISESAKNRALSGKRKQKSRHGDVTKLSRSERDKSVTREEKRREEVKTEEPPNPPAGGEFPTNSPATSPTAEPATTPVKSPKKARAATIGGEIVGIPASLKSLEFERVWAEWLAYRKEKKNPVTATSAGQQLSRLAGWGLAAAIESIRDSIANGWTGLFPPKGSRSPPRYQSAQDQILSDCFEAAASDDEPEHEGSLF